MSRTNKRTSKNRASKRHKKRKTEAKRIAVETEKRTYDEKWSKNATAHREQGTYEWMASFLEGYSTILEIGTGDGSAACQLAKAGHAVISIDENNACLDTAVRRLRQNDVACQREKRETFTESSGDIYDIRYQQIKTKSYPKPGTVLLLDGDVLQYSDLSEWLQATGPIDAVVCWLIGTHRQRQFAKSVAALRVNNSGEYRLRVQNKVHDLAGTVLRSGGVLHIVDRGEWPNEETEALLRDDMIQALIDQASTTTLEVVPELLCYREFRPSNSDSVPLEKTIGTSGRSPGIEKVALWSSISRMP